LTSLPAHTGAHAQGASASLARSGATQPTSRPALPPGKAAPNDSHSPRSARDNPSQLAAITSNRHKRACHLCSQQKSFIGFDATSTLEFVPASFKVIVHKQEKLACRACEEGVTRAAPPDRVIDAGLPGPGLLAHLLTSKYQDNIPLNRLSGIYERNGVDIAVSTLADWVGSTTDVLAPISEAILHHVLCAHVAQSDDTGLRVLDKDSPHGIKRGHVWVYVGDNKWAAFRYTPDWTGDGPLGPQDILQSRKGWLVVDGYAGYEDLFTRPGATAIECGCWSHARRYFVETLETGDVRAAIPVDYINQLFAIERQAKVDGIDHLERLARRQQQARPVIEALGRWMAATYDLEPPRSSLAGAIAYAVGRWTPLLRFLDDGRVPIENNLSERLLRPIATGRKNYLFAGSDAGGHRAAIAYTILGTCHLNGVNPWAYLRDVLTKLSAGWPNSRLQQLLPPNWAHAQQQQAQPAAAAA